MHSGISGETHGGGEFLLLLSEASLKESARGPEKNKLYGDPETDTKDNDGKTARLNAERRQRWYLGTSRQIPKKIAHFWRSNFDREGFLEFVEQRTSLDTRNDWYAVLTANGYSVSHDQVPDLIADLFVTGLDHLLQDNPAIDDKPWDPDLISATAPELATEIPTRQRFADLKSTDIYVDGQDFVAGSFRVRMPATPKVPRKIANQEKKYTEQLTTVLCRESGIDISLEALQDHGGDYLEDFNEARQDYYLADTLRELLKDVSLDGEDEFESIKDEAYHGVRPTYKRNHPSEYERLLATLEQAARISLNKSPVSNTPRLFGMRQRHGIMHMLVNDDKLRWADDNS
ncbi:ABC-three component system protein [Schaalia sp. ZJ1691]|uniref:ABC-three component system protein n=1 Tax=Schaalia sp. ZJ1691 TaxID=2709404 RepID=UPI0013EB6958|nr:ABC-three component system protein [Schaalia sp. ZJ1691]